MIAGSRDHWQASGQLRAGLDLRMTVRWLNAVSVMLMSPPWREMPAAEKRALLDRYVMPALLARQPGTGEP
jgi:TetR/AcrR family transcriptional regulator